MQFLQLETNLFSFVGIIGSEGWEDTEVSRLGVVHDVFISHARKDKSVADAICEKLESAGVRCWIAERHILAGEDWTAATRNAIGSSRVMILLLSENANSAPHIQREIAHAFYTRRIIVPVRLTDTIPRRDFLFYLVDVRWFDMFSASAEQRLEALAASINEMIPSRTAPAIQFLLSAPQRQRQRQIFRSLA